MKNFKPTVEVSVGNPADEGDPYIIFFETGNKIAYRVRVKDAYFETKPTIYLHPDSKDSTKLAGVIPSVVNRLKQILL